LVLFVRRAGTERPALSSKATASSPPKEKGVEVLSFGEDLAEAFLTLKFYKDGLYDAQIDVAFYP
jgi:hypothetical protein